MAKVYSTRYGRMCPGCDQPIDLCTCAKSSKRPPGDGVIRVRREISGRRGKPVATISGLPLDDQELKLLACQLKQKLGCGGTVKDGVIEIQGDHCETVIPWLKKLGYVVKKG